MRRRYLFLALVLLASTVTLGQNPWPITYNNVSNPDLLRRLLQNRFDIVEDDIAEFEAVIRKGTGYVFYVDSGSGSDTYTGEDWAHAKATLDAAVGLCTADRGDIIMVAQGHTEALGSAADGVDIDVAGVTVIGCGPIKNVDTMPYFDYTADVTGAFAIGADGVTLINLRFHANVTDVNEAIEIESGSTDVTIFGCIFDAEAEGTDEFLECVDSVGGTADKLRVVECEFRMGAGACNAAINTKDADYMYVAGNFAHGDYAVACIKNNTTASNHVVIENNILFNGTIGGNAGLNTEPCIEMLATTTGVIANNAVICNESSPGAAIVAADMYLTNNIYSEYEASNVPPTWVVTAVSATNVPVADSLLDILHKDTSYTYDKATDAQEALSDKLGGFSGDGGAAQDDSAKASLDLAHTDLDSLLYWQEKTISKAATSQTDDLFDVAGGGILIKSFFGIVTTNIGATGNTIKINLDADTGWVDRDFSTAVETNGDAAGTLYVFTDANPAVFTPLEIGASEGASILMTPWACGEGMIEQTCSGSTTGAITWYMTYVPLKTGVTVTAQ